jgi:ankyrin repeat protein
MGNCEAARILVEAGADPRQRTDSGKSILDLARESGNKALISILSR